MEQSVRRGLASTLLTCALLLSALSLAPPALAPAVISHPGGSIIEVVQGQAFTLSHVLPYNQKKEKK